MTDYNPFIYKYGFTEGRLQPSGYPPQDEAHVFVLGSEDGQSHYLRSRDFVEVYQDVDLTSYSFVKLAAGIWQPSAMPRPRSVSGSPATASLKHTEVLFRGHPSLTAEAFDPYSIHTGDALVYSVDGGAPIVVTFLPADEGIYTADELTGLLNPKLTNASVSAVGQVDRRQIKLSGASEGRLATLRVTGGTLCNTLRFPLGSLVRLISGNVLDSMTHSTAVVHLVNGAFTVADEGKILKISSSTQNSNGYRFITSVLGAQDVVVSPPPANDETGNFLSGTDGVYQPRTAYGGDDLSAIIAPEGDFSEADVGLPIKIAGASHPINNFVNFITSVQSPSLAILRFGVVTETPGFDAYVLGALWDFEIRIDDTLCYSASGEHGKLLLTNDIAVNVSKLTGEHRVRFRLVLSTTLV